jgi:uncharacterized damage-inducible protein DinB
MSETMKSFLAELEQEAGATRHLREGVPSDKLSWKPTDISMTLGERAMHIVGTPKFFAETLSKESLDVSTLDFSNRPSAKATDELLAAFDEAMGETTKALSAWSDDFSTGTFRFTEGKKELMAGPRAGLFRTLGMNHMYHHRGQLSTYLRLLGGPVPAVYGQSADEKPIG